MTWIREPLVGSDEELEADDPEDEDQTPETSVGLPGGGVDIERWSLRLGAEGGARRELFLEAAVSGTMRFRLASDADRFVSSALREPVTPTPFDVTLGVSSQRGLYLGDGGALELDIPVHRSIGGVVEVRTLHLGVRPGEEALRISAGITASAEIGPVHLIVQRIGLESAWSFPEDRDGNLGALDVRLGFLPPTGVGLVIDAPGIGGGGFVEHDHNRGRYAGALHLKLAERIDIKALCVVDTDVPDLPDGYSALVSLAVTWSPPVPLLLGFTLNGIGGLLGINRTINVEALRSGLKTGAMDAILFPRDPLRDLPRLLGQVRSVFPPAPGMIVAGPVLKIGWGKPTLVEFTLGVIVELPRRSLLSPRRILVVGQALIERPKGQETIRLRLDGLGVIDRVRGESGIDLSLFDSTILGSTVQGDAVYRSRTSGSNPFSGLSVGGFHPEFPVPTGLPFLNRFSLNLTGGDNPRILFAGYFAITSNTVQFGARADFFYKKGGFSVAALISLDVLIDRESDEWIADFSLGATVKWRGRTLFGVQLDGTLGGNAVLFIRGRAKISIWIWSKTFTVDKTLRERRAPPLPRSIDPMPELLQALKDPDNWIAQDPREAERLAVFGDIDAVDGVVAHPLGRIGVRQQVVPLSMNIARFRGARPRGTGRFEIRRVLINGEAQDGMRPLREHFAPGEFLELSDDERLARPSFERMQNGVEVGSDAISHGPGTRVDIGFDTILIDDIDEPATEPVVHTSPASEIVNAVAQGAVARKRADRPGAQKYAGASRGLHLRDQGYAVVSRDTLAADADIGRETDGTFTSAWEAKKRAESRTGSGRLLQVVAEADAA